MGGKQTAYQVDGMENLYQRYRGLDGGGECSEPTKRGVNALTRVVYHGANCARRKADRQRAAAKIRKLRAGLKGRFRVC